MLCKTVCWKDGDAFLVLVSHCLAVAYKRADATSVEINGTFSPGIGGQWSAVTGGGSLAEAGARPALLMLLDRQGSMRWHPAAYAGRN